MCVVDHHHQWVNLWWATLILTLEYKHATPRTVPPCLGKAVARVVVRRQDPHAVTPPLQRHGRIHNQLLRAA